MIFKDRSHAGRLLAVALARYAKRAGVIVLGLPRGGVVVASEVAKQLQVPLDVMVVRKLGVPGWEELAMGAIASGGVRVIHEEVVRDARVTPADIDRVTAKEMLELQRRELAFRGHRAPPDVAGKTVLLVDDGIATGSTIRAAVRALQQRAPARLVVAVPVTAEDAADLLQPLVDEFVALQRPVPFSSVGQWYGNFSQTTDAEARALLDEAAARVSS